MKTTIIKIVIALLLIVILGNCKPVNNYYDFRLKVINKSNKTIFADFYQSYPDTSLSVNSHFDNSSKEVEPNETCTLGRGGSWETAFNEQIHQKLMVFIFDASIVENTPWNTIRKNYLILKRYDVTLKDLDSLNFYITYQ